VSRAQRSTSRAFTPVFAGYCDALQTQDRSSLWRSRMCFALHRIRDTNRRSGVAGKPQAAAIRAETLARELIVTGSARSVGRGASIRPRGTARAMIGVRGGSRPQGLGDAFRSAAFAGSALRRQPRAALQFATAQCGSWHRPRARR